MRKLVLMVAMVFVATVALGAAAQGATLQEIQERGTIRVAWDEATNKPFFFMEDGIPKGLDADMAEAVAEKLGVELEGKPMPWSDITEAWSEGFDWEPFDIAIAAITVTPERAEICAFSDWYFMTGQMALVKRGGPIATADDLEGKRIAVQEDTTGHSLAREMTDDIVTFQTVKELAGAVASGEAQAAIYDGTGILWLARENESLKALEDRLTRERYAVAMPQGNDALMEAVNEAVREHRKELYEKWFK
ncbi:MAG: transporter substrate-binding domain-containing protein [Synergistales bacterium]|nr:transporter substrate-binding domain-containing protein [Synergistales bacterium]